MFSVADHIIVTLSTPSEMVPTTNSAGKAMKKSVKVQKNIMKSSDKKRSMPNRMIP